MGGARDRLSLEGMQFHGHHGATQAERELGGRIQVDVELHVDLSIAGRSDDLADTVDYAAVFAQVRSIVEERSFNLLEALADAIASALLGDRRVTAVRVLVAKRPPVDGIVDRAAVVIEREAR